MNILSIDVGIKNLAFCLFEVESNSYSVQKWDVISLMENDITKCNFCNDVQILQCDNDAKYRYKGDAFCLKHSRQSQIKKPISDLAPKNIRKLNLTELVIIAAKYDMTDYQKPIKKNDLCRFIIERTSETYFETITHSKAKDENIIVVGNTLKSKFDLIFKDLKIHYVLIENQISPIANRMKTIQGMIAQYFIMQAYKIDIRFLSASNKLKSFVSKGTNYSERKKIAVKECLSLLVDNVINATFIPFYKSHKKKDDLADCFLQAIYFINTGAFKADHSNLVKMHS